ncbi:MAG TPA: cytochrome b [Steroidobacteraceae bacterium]|nr:cytochrome b [Steroidobacteraceae bacterium]
MRAATPRYSTLVVAIHWTTALLVLIAYLFSDAARQVRADPPVLHFACGLAAMLLVVPRLIARLSGGSPPAQHAGAGLLALAAKFGHAALYLLLIAVPLTGWYAVSRLGVPVVILGLNVPPIAAAVKGNIGPIGALHQVGGNAILILAGLHAAMGLWHQFVRRDHTLERMRF